MRTFRVYFSDGNQKLLEGRDILHICNYIEDGYQYENEVYTAEDITKIEEVKSNGQ